mmetsp:Transcript_12878/g.54098  ORF Transcript_12878/g.54098 Transcript_12878/m.54098 type:complete len:266 (+) Transcript_12878:1910-2707(+)
MHVRERLGELHGVHDDGRDGRRTALLVQHALQRAILHEREVERVVGRVGARCDAREHVLVPREPLEHPQLAVEPVHVGGGRELGPLHGDPPAGPLAVIHGRRAAAGQLTGRHDLPLWKVDAERGVLIAAHALARGRHAPLHAAPLPALWAPLSRRAASLVLAPSALAVAGDRAVRGRGGAPDVRDGTPGLLRRPHAQRKSNRAPRRPARRAAEHAPDGGAKGPARCHRGPAGEEGQRNPACACARPRGASGPPAGRRSGSARRAM